MRWAAAILLLCGVWAADRVLAGGRYADKAMYEARQAADWFGKAIGDGIKRISR